jgi:hypothetical protein
VLSDAASYITGTHFSVDGGFLAAAHELEAIEGVNSLTIGPPALISWSDPDQGWDFGLVILLRVATGDGGLPDASPSPEGDRAQ